MTPRALLAARLDRLSFPLAVLVALLCVAGLALLTALPCEHAATLAVSP